MIILSEVRVELNFLEKGQSLDSIKKQLQEIAKIANQGVKFGAFDSDAIKKSGNDALNAKKIILSASLQAEIDADNKKKQLAEQEIARQREKEKELTRLAEVENQKRIALIKDYTSKYAMYQNAQLNLSQKFNEELGKSAVAATYLMGSAIRELLPLEKQIFDLGVVANKSAADLGALRDELISISKDVPFSAAEIGKAVNDVARTGKTVEEAFAIVRESSKMATASGEELGNSVKVVTKILTAYNLDIRGNADVLDKLHSVAANTPLSFDSLGDAMKNSAGAKTMAPIIVILYKKAFNL